MKKIILGIGSNLGHRSYNFNEALSKLSSFGKVSKTSFLYQTAPMYELNQPAFLNAAIVFETKLSPAELLVRIQDIEMTLGRTSELKKVWKGPRPIDIDILFYENHVIQTQNLTIPHPSIQERDFVLKPLVDLEPDFVHPVFKKTAKELDAENDRTNANLSYPKRVWSINNPILQKEETLNFEEETVGMGVINCTTDSLLSDKDGTINKSIDYDMLTQKCEEFYNNHFKILDIGGESTRPGAEAVDPRAEFERIEPMLEKIRNHEHLKNLLISLDTRKSYVAEKGLESGAAIINDVSGGTYDENLVKLVGKKNVPYVVMHTRGTPKTMTEMNTYSNLIYEVVSELEERIDIALNNGVYKWNIFVDPGIGFAKRRNQNIEIIKNLDVLRNKLPYPLLIGYSNKKFIQEITGVDDTVYGNSVLAGACIQKGASILRMHDPKLYKSILLADSVYKNRKIYI